MQSRDADGREPEERNWTRRKVLACFTAMAETTPTRWIGAMGISMGGYGALLFAEKYPHLINAVAAISPAIWTSFAQAKVADAGAYASAAAFAANDAVTHASPPSRPGRIRV